MADPIVGIDLGTSNTVVAHADATGKATVLADDAGYKIHPSVVSFHPGGGVIVGAAAKQRKVIDPQNTIYSVKRLIGRAYSSKEVQTAKSRAPFVIKEGANRAPVISTRGGDFAVPEISAIVLDHARNIASARLGQPVGRAVVTVPASFNDAQRSATATAGAIAGLTVVRVLNEPTAAALAYGHARDLRQIIAVYDFGGGTFDITLLRLADQVYEVLGTAGDSFLGGDDLDERLVDKMVAKFLAENRVDLTTNEVSMMRLRAVAEQTKIELSRRSRAVVRVDEIAYGPRGAPLNLNIEITRDELVRDVSDIIDRTFPVCREALQLAKLGVDQVDDVVLVGGTTKIPYVREQVSRFFGKQPRQDVNPEDAVALGAALQATSLERILSRRSSSKVSVPQPIPKPPDEEDTNQSGAVMAPPDLMHAPPAAPRPGRTTAGYAAQRPSEPRPDTSYSMTRKGVRDEVETRAPTGTQPGDFNPAPTIRGAAPPAPATPVGFDDALTPPPQAMPLGRITTRPGTAPVVSPAAQKTLFGVPAAPVGPLPVATPPPITYDAATPAPFAPPRRPSSGGGAPIAFDPPTRPSSAPGGFDAPTSTDAPRPPPFEPPPFAAPRPPPIPAAQAPTMIVPMPPSPASTLPMAPQSPIAPATSPTMIAQGGPASTAPGMGLGSLDLELLAEPAPQTTARGFEAPAPQAFPILPPPAAYRAPPTVLEVTPRSLGIGTVAGFCEELIRRNSRVPTEMKKMFTTSRDRQDMVRIVVCQGESRRLDNNTVIGDLVLQNLPPRPRGETAIEVTFHLDASGILQVRARDAHTGAEQRASLDLVGGVAREDLAASQNKIQQLRR